MRHLETDTEQKVCRKAKDHGVLNFKLFGKHETGIPDRVFLIPGGRPLFIEFKRAGEDPRPKQDWWHDILRQLGYQVEVHDNADEALKSIEKYARIGKTCID